MKSRVMSVGLWVVFAVLLSMAFAQGREIARNPSISLRFTQPVSGEAAFGARQYGIAQDTFWPTFWEEEMLRVQVRGQTTQVTGISFSGDGALVWPAVYVAGGVPASIDGVGVALSTGLAHRLFASTDIVGMAVYVNDSPRVIRGVFDYAGELVLVSYSMEYRGRSFTAAELAGGPNHPTRQDVESFALLAGLGRPGHIVTTAPTTLATMLPWLPLMFPVLFALWKVLAFGKTYYPRSVTPMVLGGLVVLAVALPFLLGALPYWMIPTHFSDFAFWSGLRDQAADSVRGFFALNPTLVDVEQRLALLRLGVTVLGALIVGIVVCKFPQSYGNEATPVDYLK